MKGEALTEAKKAKLPHRIYRDSRESESLMDFLLTAYFSPEKGLSDFIQSGVAPT